MATFGERVKELRNARGMTQRQMAAALGITERSYQRYEVLESPSNENLIKMADFFDVSTDYLLGRTNYWQDKDGHIHTKVPPDIFSDEDKKRIIKGLSKPDK